MLKPVPATVEHAAPGPEQAEAASPSALVGSGVLLAAAVAVANAMNAVFQLALARVLDPSEYSLLAALLAVVLVGAVPPLALQATTARAVARQLAQGQPMLAGALLRGTLRSVLAWSGALLGLTALLVPAAAALGLEQPLPIAATAATVAVALAVPVVWGGLQGAGRFPALAAAHLLFAGSRLVAGLGIGLAGGGVGAVMLGVAGATALTALATFRPLAPLVRGAAPGRGGAPALRPNAAAALGLTALGALSMSDLVVAKLAFSGPVAGDYAAASVAARALLLVPIAVTTVLFPRVATLGDRRRERRHLLVGLLVVGGAGAALTGLLWAWAGPLLELAFGGAYREGEAWLGPLSLAMALYALATVYLYHYLSLGRARFSLVLLALLGGQIAALAVLHARPADLVGVQIVSAAVTLLACEVWHILRQR
jgi:O-antigen/teichoic acid export membrane protein